MDFSLSDSEAGREEHSHTRAICSCLGLSPETCPGGTGRVAFARERLPKMYTHCSLSTGIKAFSRREFPTPS